MLHTKVADWAAFKFILPNYFFMTKVLNWF